MHLNILCVDESNTTRHEFSKMLNDYNISFINVKHKSEAAELLYSISHDIRAIIWAINNIECNDFKQIKAIKFNKDFINIPLIVVSQYAHKEMIVKAIESGASEFIARPYDKQTVKGKICNLLGLNSNVSKVNILDNDVVTFCFKEMLSKEIKAAGRGNYCLSILLATIKPVNEENNYNTVCNINEIADLFSKVVKTRLRETDTVFCCGMNNILLLLPFTDKQGTISVYNKVNEIFDTHSLISQKNKGYKIDTASVSFPEDGRIMEKLIEKLEK